MNKDVKFALIGNGRVASRHIEALTKRISGGQLVAVCDSNPSRLEDKRSFGDRVEVFNSSADLYGWGKFDVAAIATPSGDHYEHAKEAILAGKHVVVEKPVALRIEHANELILLAERNNVKAWVIHQNRYNPAILKTKEAIERGRLGTKVLATVRVRWCRNAEYYTQDNWHGRWASDGGVISQQAIHHLDALRWLFGDVESVEAVCRTRLAPMECDDLTIATMSFKNGALGIVEATTATRPRDLEASLSLLGEQGTIVLGGIAMNTIQTWEFTAPGDGDSDVPQRYSQVIPSAYGLGHDVLYQKVVDSIVDGAPIEVSLDEGKKTLEIVHALYASNELGRRVKLDEGLSSAKLGVRTLGKNEPGKAHKELQLVQKNISNQLPEFSKNIVNFAGIIGESPSLFAKSPLIWNSVFEKLSFQASYASFDVPKSENLAALVDTLRNSSFYLGGSVTMPYKIGIMKYLDEVDPTARAIGAVNTIVRTKNGKLVGYNTDGIGGVESIKKGGVELANARTLLIGAGGAARSLAFCIAKASRSGKLWITNRTEEKALTLVKDLKREFNNVDFIPFEEIAEILPQLQLLVNASTVGQSGLQKNAKGDFVNLGPFSPLSRVEPPSLMVQGSVSNPEIERELLSSSLDSIMKNSEESLKRCLLLNRQAIVFDAVYSPLETVFLAHSRQTGHKTINGKMMNIFQAADAMFNKVFHEYLSSRGLWTETTYKKIVDQMQLVW